MNIHTFDLHGKVITRTSQNRTYTHVVVVTREKADGTFERYVDSWAGSQDLAMKASTSTRNRLTIDPKKRAADTTGWYARYEQEHGWLVNVSVHPITTFDQHTPKPRAKKERGPDPKSTEGVALRQAAGAKTADNPGVE